MKIQVNKNKAQENKDRVIKEILEMAKNHAAQGLNSFVYWFKPGERESLPPPIITISVREASEDTVKCAHRGDNGDHIKFYIRDKSKYPEYFLISGYWKDNKMPFEDYLVKETHDIIPEEDDQIFFYGLSERDIQESIELGEETGHEFVITEYRRQDD